MGCALSEGVTRAYIVLLQDPETADFCEEGQRKCIRKTLSEGQGDLGGQGWETLPFSLLTSFSHVVFEHPGNKLLFPLGGSVLYDKTRNNKRRLRDGCSAPQAQGPGVLRRLNS